METGQRIQTEERCDAEEVRTLFRIVVPLLIALAATLSPVSAAKDDNSPDYIAYREKALKTTPSDLHIDVGDHEPFGVVADIHFSFGVITVVVFKNGEATMYNSQGGYRRDGDKVSEEIRTAARKVLAAAATEVPRMKKTTDFSLAALGHFKVYVLTRANIFSDDSDWPNPSAPAYSLTRAANEIITAYRHLEPDPKYHAD